MRRENKRARLKSQLAFAAPALRRAIIDDMDDLPRGAAAVVGRLFDAMRAAGDPLTHPSAAAFRAAATSEPTFHLLLRTLTTYAPQINTVAATEVSDEWYAHRKTRV
jgi:hypothetical protein